MNRRQLEQRYGVKIVKSDYWNPMEQKYRNEYILYTADGCKWDAGFKTIKEVEAECRKYAQTFDSIHERERRQEIWRQMRTTL